MSKVASAASVMGVPIDQLNAMLATTISVTRQAPESIGTAYKTIFARIGDIEAGEGEVTLGQYTSKMKELGFNVLDANQKLRDQGDVITEIGNNWNNLSREQQIALAQTMAGARQYNNLLALFDNWDMYTDAIKTSADAAGTLNKQNETYLESTEAHLNKLTAAQERFQNTILDSDSINSFTDVLTDLTDLASSFIEAIGGGSGVLLNFGSILTRVFSKQIAREALPAVRGIMAPFQNNKQIDNTFKILENLKDVKDFGSEKAVTELRAKVEKDAKLFKFMTTEQQQQYYENLANYSDQRVKAEASDKRTAETRTKMAKYANYLSGKNKLAIDTNQYQEVLNSDAVNFRDTDSNRILEARKKTAEELKGQTKILDDEWKKLKTIQNPDDAEFQIKNVIAEAEKLKSVIDDSEQLDIITDASKEEQLKNINEILQAVQNLQDKLNNVPRYKDESQNQINERNELTSQKSEHEQFKRGYQADLDNINEQVKYLETEKKRFSDKKDGQGKSNFDRTVERKTSDLIQKEKEKLPEGTKLSTQRRQELKTQAITSTLKEQAATEKMLAEYKEEQSKLNKEIIEEEKKIKEIDDKIEETKKGIARNQGEINKELDETLQKGQKDLNNASLLYNVSESEEATSNTQSSNKQVVIQGDENVRSQNSRGDGDANDLLTTQARAEAAATAVVNLSSQIMEMGSIINNIQALPNIWQNNEIDAGEKVGQTISNLAMTILPAAANAFYTLATAATAAQTAMGIIGVISMAIGATIGVIQAVIQWQENERKARIEANKAIIEENDARLQEIDTNTKLYNSYSELEKNYKLGNTSKQELLNSTDELIDAYDIENGKLLKMTGNYEALAAAIKKKRLEDARDKEKTAKESLEASVNIAKDNATFGQSSITFLKNQLPQVSAPDKNNLESIKKYLEEEGLGYDILPQQTGGYEVRVALPELDDFYNLDKEQILNLMNRLSDIEELDIFTDDESIGNYKELIEGRIEEIQKYLDSDEFQQIQEDKQVAQQATFERSAYEKDLDSVTTFSEYEQKVEEIRKSMSDVKDEDFLKYVDELGTEFSQLYSAQQRLLANFGEGKEDVEAFIKGLSAEELAQLVTIGLSGDETVEEIKLILKAVKGQLSTEDTTITMEVRGDLGSEKIAEANEKLTEYTKLLDGIEKRSLLGQADILEDIGTKQIEKNSDYLKVFQMSGAEKDELKTAYQDRINEIYSENSELKTYENVSNLDTKKLYQAMTFNTLVPPPDKESLEFYKEYEATIKDLQQYMSDAEIETSKFYDEQGKLRDGITQEDIITALFGGEKEIAKLEVLRQKVGAMNKGIKAIDNALSGKEIQTTVFDLISEKSDEIITKFDIITEMGESMGDGFVIAADKVEEFASKFPELLKDYEVLSDGSIKLSQDQLQATVGAIHAEQKAKAEAQIKELDTQIELNEMKIKMMEEQNALTLKFLQGDMKAEEYKNEFTATAKRQEGELQDKLNELGVDSTNIALDNLGDVATGVDALTEKFIKLSAVISAVARGEDASQVAKEFADTVVPDMSSVTKEFLEGINSSVKMEDITSNEETKAAYEQALKSYQLNLQQINLLKSETEQLKAQKVTIESGINASLAAINDNLVDQLDLLDDVVDRYHDINVILGQIERLTNKIVKEQDKLVGPEYLGALEAENQAMDVTNLGLQKKRDIAVGEQQELQTQMAGYGFTFNEDGTIGNYGGVMQGYIDAIREAQLKGDKETAEDLEKRYDKVKELASNYDTLVNETIPDIDEEIEGNLDRKIENNIKKFNYAIELQLDMSEAEKQWRDFRKQILEKDDFKGQIEIDTEYLFDPQSLKNIENLIGHVNSIADEIEKMQNGETSSIYGNDLAQAEEDLEQAVSNMTSAVEDWQSTYEAVSENLLNEMSKLSDTFDKLTGNYDTINEWLSNWKDVTSLTKGEESYADFDNIYRLQHQANLEKLQADRDSADTWKEVMDNTKEGTDEWNEAVSNWTSASSQLFSDFKSAIENAAEAFSNKIKLNFQNFYAGISNGGQVGDFEREKYNWEAAVKRDEQYLDTVTKSYEIDKLRGKINTEINKTSSSSARQKLIDFQKKELKLLEEKDKLSQYDIDRSNKKYEILQKTIALEEAQNNKSQMRLRRDSQGNYQYQYVADTGAIDEAEQELKDLYQALYQLDEDKIKENTNRYYELWTEAEQQIQTAISILQGEELEEELRRIENYFLPQFTELGIEQEQVYKNIQESASASYLATQTTAADSFVAISDYVTGLNPSFEALRTSLIGPEDSVNSAFGTLKNSMVGQEGSLKAAFDALGDNAENILPEHVKEGINVMSPVMFDGKDSFKGKLDTLFDQCIADSKTFNNNLKQIEGWSGIDITKTNTDLATAAKRTGTLDDKFKGLNSTLSTSIGRLTNINKYLQGVIDKTSKDIEWTIKIKENLEKVKEKFDGLASAAANAAGRLATIKETDYNKTVSVSIKYPDKWKAKLDAFQTAINNLKGKTVTITTNYVTTNDSQGGGSETTKKNNSPKNTTAFQSTVYTKGSKLNSAGTQWNYDKDNTKIISAGATYLSEKKYKGYKNEQEYYQLYDAYGNVLADMNLREKIRSSKKDRARVLASPYFGDQTELNVPGGTKTLYDPTPITVDGGTYYQIWYKQGASYVPGYVSSLSFKSYDTGGYTGNWNSKEGRMAMLHEKELVLNAKDTKNILAAVNSVRAMQSIITSLDLNALATKKQMISNLTTPIVAKEGITDNSLDQNVQIEANFPNVRDSRQIEEAFDNLVNMATQYANKQTR